MKGIDRMISVIVPVYNVESYLRECLDSIVNQTYTDLEIILVDDGSTDGSGAVCDEYAKLDKRIKVFHQENRGAGAAKNRGLREARGKWLSIVDGDDYIELDAYEYMLSELTKHNADVIQCAFRDVYTDGTVDRILLKEYKEFNAEEYLKRYVVDWSCGLQWDKLFLRSLFEGIDYVEGHIIDDEFFVYQGIMNADKIIHTPRITYNYRRRLSSVMKSKVSGEKIVYDKLEYTNTRRKLIAARFPNLKALFDIHFIEFVKTLIKSPYLTEGSIAEIKKTLKEFLKEKNRTGVGLTKRLSVARILISSNKKLLKGRKQLTVGKTAQRCFK